MRNVVGGSVNGSVSGVRTCGSGRRIVFGCVNIIIGIERNDLARRRNISNAVEWRYWTGRSSKMVK